MAVLDQPLADETVAEPVARKRRLWPGVTAAVALFLLVLIGLAIKGWMWAATMSRFMSAVLGAETRAELRLSNSRHQVQ